MPFWFWMLLGWSLLASVAAFGLYGLDKRRAIRKGQGKSVRRIPERSLHAWEALGGWPGGLAARRVFHHKTDARVKARFVWTSRAIVATHLLGWCALAYVMLRG